MGAIVKVEQNALGDDQQQFLTFLLDGEMFAVGILSVKEIIEYGSLTVVPMMPPCIRGVINLRGAVVPVVDLASRFGREPRPVTRRSCIVIVEVLNAAGDGERQDLGIIVDSVSEVLEIRGSEIEPPPAFGARIRTDFIHGMGKVNGRFVMILAVDQVLSLADLTLVAEASQASESEALAV